MHLNQKQLNRIKTALISKGFDFQPLETELIDDLATAIELKMEQGQSFESAFSEIMEAISPTEIEDLQRNMVRTLRTNRGIKRFTRRQSFWLTLSLLLWVVAEFVIGRMTGVIELGPFFGLLSQIFIGYWIYTGLRTIHRQYFEGFAKFRQLFLRGIMISGSSALAFSGFLLLFWTFVYPDFAEAWQMDPEEVVISPDQFLMTNVIATGISVFILGSLIAAVSSAILVRKKRLTSI